VKPVLPPTVEPPTRPPADPHNCPDCANRNPAADPPCPVCGADEDPETGMGIPY
jgi:hypothetical protein